MPLRPEAARYIADHLGDAFVQIEAIPYMPYMYHQLGFIDCADGTGSDRSRYILRWLGRSEPSLVIDRKLTGERQSVIAVSGKMACNQAVVLHHIQKLEPANQAMSLEEDLDTMYELLQEVGYQARIADQDQKHYLHHSSEEHFMRPRFIQIPPGLLQQM